MVLNLSTRDMYSKADSLLETKKRDGAFLMQNAINVLQNATGLLKKCDKFTSNQGRLFSFGPSTLVILYSVRDHNCPHNFIL